MYILGPKEDDTKAKQFILKIFRDILKEANKKPRRTENLPPNKRAIETVLYSHYTCATDTENIKVVFEAVRHTIVMSNLSQFQLLSHNR